MGQGEVVEVLEKSKVPMSLKEISTTLNDSETKVSRIISCLLKHNEIQCIELSKELSMKFLNCTRKARLYYI